jgi:hypothetical protein
VPCPPGPHLAPPQFVGAVRPELRDPAAHRLVRHLDTALGEQFLDVAEAQGKAQVEPNCVRDHFAREPVAVV